MSIKITYFVHATTADNEQNISSGWKDVELSALGIEQARKLGGLAKNQIVGTGVGVYSQVNNRRCGKRDAILYLMTDRFKYIGSSYLFLVIPSLTNPFRLLQNPLIAQ